MYNTCRDCRRPMSSARPKPPTGHVRYGAYGRCQQCDKRLIKAGEPRNTPIPGRLPVRALETDTWPGRP